LYGEHDTKIAEEAKQTASRRRRAKGADPVMFKNLCANMAHRLRLIATFPYLAMLAREYKLTWNEVKKNE
jgi:hypothetical protein